MPLDSGVNTAGLALMGLFIDEGVFEAETPNNLDAGIAGRERGRRRFANLAGRVENSYWKIRSYIKHASNR
jgi:hypothetical protein